MLHLRGFHGSPVASNAVMDNIDALVIVVDKENRIIDFNRAACTAISLSPAYIGKPLDSLPAPWNNVYKHGDDAGQKREVTIGRGEGQQIYELTISPIQYERKGLQGHVLLFHDVTERKQTEKRLRQLSRAVEQSPNSIVITDLNGAIEYVNPRFVALTGYTREEAYGQNPRILQSGQTPRGTYTELWNAITAGKEWRGEFVNKKKNGELYYEAVVIAPIINRQGVTTNYVAIKENITEQKEVERLLRQANAELQAKYDEIHALQGKLQEQAVRDGLTGLFNRRYLDETLERELAAAERSKHPVGIIMFDIDHFKELNDSCGHGAGDKLLVALGDLIRERTREMDIACRYGGEEFVVVMPGTAVEVAAVRAEELRAAVAELRVQHQGQFLRSTISVGVSAFPLHGTDEDSLLHAADGALYAAKAAGRNAVRVAGRGCA